jgi:hypothetical protein
MRVIYFRAGFIEVNTCLIVCAEPVSRLSGLRAIRFPVSRAHYDHLSLAQRGQADSPKLGPLISVNFTALFEAFRPALRGIRASGALKMRFPYR